MGDRKAFFPPCPNSGCMATAEALVKLGDKGRVTIPAAARDKLGVEEGDYVQLEMSVEECDHKWVTGSTVVEKEKKVSDEGDVYVEEEREKTETVVCPKCGEEKEVDE